MSIKQMKTLTVGETTYQVVDSTVPDWAREPTKPIDFANGGTMGGSLIINGDLTVNGISTTVETFNENINVEDNTITLRHNATTGLQNGDYTGIVAHNYDGANNGMLVFDNSGTAYVGDEGDLQPLATRAFSESDDGALATWDATAKTLVKAPLEVADIVTTDNIDSLNKAISTAITDASVAYQKEVTVKDTSYAEVNKIGGMSRKCPNLIPYPYTFGSSNTVSGVTFTANSDGSITVNGTANAYIWRTISSVNIPVGTYNMSANSNAGSDISGVYWYLYSSSENFTISQIAGSTITTNSQQYSVIMAIDEGITLNNVTFKPMLNAGSTALPYEPYYAGLRDTKVTVVKSVGANLWDEEWENTSWTNSIASKNNIPIKPNTAYYISANISNGIFFYDENLAFISRVYSNSFVTPANAKYMKFFCGDSYGATYKGDIMLNKGLTPLPYTPYQSETLPIPEAVQALDGYGNGVNADCYNYIDLEKKQFVKRVGVVDMGTLTWGANNSVVGGFQAEVLRMTKKPVAIISTQYSFGVANFSWANFNSYPDKTVNVSGVSNFIYLKDSEYTDAATFKAAMSGVMLVYELAEPEVTDISNLITPDNLIGVDGNGTITFENEYGYAVPSEVTLYPEKTDIIASKKIIGNLTGTSTRAIGDENGNRIVDTYIKNNVDSIQAGGVTMGLVDAGNTWRFNDDTTELDKCLYETSLWTPNVTFTCNGETYNCMTFNNNTDLYYGDHELLVYSGGWVDEAYKTIEITGDCDSTLLEYLSKMATTIPSKGIQIGNEFILERDAKTLSRYLGYAPNDFFKLEHVGKVNETMGDYFPTTGIIDDGHIYLLIFRDAPDSFHYFLPTFGYREVNNGNFGGYSAYNNDTPLYVKYKVVSYDDNLMPIYGVFLFDKDGNNKTAEIAPIGTYSMDVYKLI